MTGNVIEGEVISSETVGEEPTQWEDLSLGTPGQDDDGQDDEVSPAAAAAEEGDDDSTPATPETPTKAEVGKPAAKPATSAEEDPAAEDATETPDTPVPEVSAPETPPPLTPEQQAEKQANYDAWVKEQTTILEKHYGLSEEDAQQLQTEPELVMPRLLAQMHMNVQRSLLEGLQTVLPQVLGQTQANTQREQGAKDTFYGRWPELAKHHDKVLEVGKMYRQLNPKATPAEAVEAIGLMASQALNIKPSAAKAAPVAAKQAVAKPLRPGSSGTKPAAPVAKGAWDELLDD